MPRGRKNKPEIDICRVQTDRLRKLTAAQLERAARRVGPLYEIPKKQQGTTRPRWLLALFLTELRNIKKPTALSERSRLAYVLAYGHEPMTDAAVRRSHIAEADRAERLIWDMQAKRGCAIKPTELVARDAAREGRSPDELDRIRGRRRPKIR